MAAERDFDEKWVALIYNLITKSPPGSLSDTCSACRQLTHAPIPDELLGRACTDHNERLLWTVQLPSPAGCVGILCENARASSRAQKAVTYKHPATRQKFFVDQESGECVQVKEQAAQREDLEAELHEMDRSVAEPFKLALERHLGSYMRQHFPDTPELIGGGLLHGSDGMSASAVFITPGQEVANEFVLRILLSSRRARPKGYWTGNWTSQWLMAIKPEQKEPAVITGLIEFRTHYAEDSNVHTRRKATRKARINEVRDPDRFAREVVEAIHRLEDEFHCATEEYCATAGAGALKAMRRVLPMSKERFDWRPFRQALVQDIKKATVKHSSNECFRQASEKT